MCVSTPYWIYLEGLSSSSHTHTILEQPSILLPIATHSNPLNPNRLLHHILRVHHIPTTHTHADSSLCLFHQYSHLFASHAISTINRGFNTNIFRLHIAKRNDFGAQRKESEGTLGKTNLINLRILSDAVQTASFVIAHVSSTKHTSKVSKQNVAVKQG